MSYPKKIKKNLNLAVQEKLLGVHYPEFKTKFASHNRLLCYGRLKPTARSQYYDFEMIYVLGKRPRIKILKPKLVTNFNDDKIPHTFPGNIPCLYYRWDFDGSMIIAKTIIPWLITWLYFYEDWHVTGVWNGKGIHTG